MTPSRLLPGLEIPDTMRSWRVWLGFAISFVFLYIAFREQDFAEIWESLRAAEYRWLIPAMGAYFLGVSVRAVRWHLLLRTVQDVSARRLFPIVVIGYMANNILPLRAGELVRSYALSARFQVRKSASLATIAIERIFDGLTMLGFLLVASLTIALTTNLRNVALAATALFVALSVVLFGFVLIPAMRHRSIDLALRLLPVRIGERVEQMAHSFFEGLGILRRKQDLLNVLLTSILAWLCEATMYLLIAHGFSLGISPAAILLVTAVANLATIIPSSPGYVGPFEAAVVSVLAGTLGLSRELALSYAVVVHAALYVPVTLLGVLFWWRESFSWRDVRRAEELAS
ncbi:MAG TPA: lysylphosphatidylglycerol synthase transmembrane domain-containing protein [Thermomicrobiales bacterium]|nr:lysylphosphatidylglycerol synthase transmembrane domain-containing protein [Thermomicrobiales bacterium]